MEKRYTTPEFKLIRQDELNTVFFAGSGTPGAPAFGASLGSMSKTNSGW